MQGAFQLFWITDATVTLGGFDIEVRRDTGLIFLIHFLSVPRI